ncbi:LOW QUALITY PROTEIN: WD repeat-containing protein 88 [Cyanocitta cristata]
MQNFSLQFLSIQILFKILGGHSDNVSSCHFCFEDTKILSWSSNALDCCFAADSHYLCTAPWDKSLKIWDIKTGEFMSLPVSFNQGLEDSVSSSLFSQDREAYQY